MATASERSFSESGTSGSVDPLPQRPRDAPERVVTGALRGLLQAPLHPRGLLLEHRQEERLLRGEVVVEDGLGAPRLAGDVGRARAVVAALGEQAAPRAQEAREPLVAGHAAAGDDGAAERRHHPTVAGERHSVKDRVTGGPRPAARSLRCAACPAPPSSRASRPPAIRGITLGPFDIRLYALCLLAGVVAADLAHHAPLEGRAAATRTWCSRWRCGRCSPASSAPGSTTTSRARTSSATSGTRPSRSGRAASASGAASLAGVAVGAYVVHRRGASVLRFMDAAAPGDPDRPGHRAARQLLQPGALRRALRPALGARGGPGATGPTTTSTDRHVPPHVPLRDALELRRGGADHLDRQAASASARRASSASTWRSTRWGGSSGSSCGWTRRSMFLGQRLNFYVALVLLIGALGGVRVEPAPRGRPRAADAGALPRAPGGRARPARIARALSAARQP